MIEDIKILEAVERYISGEMSPDERVYFEQLRKSNPEVDQMVVEHTYFLQQMSRFDETRKLKGILADTHIHLAEKGLIQSPRLKGRAKLVYLYNRHKRVAAIAASIAGITALTFSALVWSVSPAGKPMKEELTQLKRENDVRYSELRQENKELKKTIEQVATSTAAPVKPVIEFKSGGTGFLVDTKGYIVTNEHVISGARHIAVQTSNGPELTAEVVYRDIRRDLAILKISDKSFKIPGTIPYSLKRSSPEIAEPIFTLGYPRADIVYGEGYLSARTGFRGDTLSCQITIPANRGNSGSPILNRNGEVIGILNAKQNTAEGAVFAIHSKYILQAMQELQKDTAYGQLKLPTSTPGKGSERQQLVRKISDFVYMVKVD